ncbi:MAG: DUF3078 domain-containing protein [Caldithrix sp.]|nr:DUF3078 domain-containing protein [Caldithrix sp.]
MRNIWIVFCIFAALNGPMMASAVKEKPKNFQGWKKELLGNLNFTQNSFDNWAQGGENSWSWQVEMNAKAEYKTKRFNWSNSGKFSYGRSKVSGADSRKAADEIKIESVFTQKMGIYVNPYASFSGLTQSSRGYKYTSDTSKKAISDFFDPAYFVQSFGLGYEYNDLFKIRLGGSIKETITNRFAEMYAEGQNFRVEFGSELVSDVRYKINSTMKYTSKLELFSNLTRFEAIDVNWDHLISAKVAEFVQVSFNFNLFYDRDVTAKRQFKQTLAAGLRYNFY